MTTKSSVEHWKQVSRSYGRIETSTEHGDTVDLIHVETWGVTLRVFRERGATEPNYEALCAMGHGVALGLDTGIKRGREQAFTELRALIGVKEPS